MDNSTNHRYNETKYIVLSTLINGNGRYYTPAELAEISGISENAMSQTLRRLVSWKYIHRKGEYRSTKKNKYCYGYNKDKGNRVYYDLDKRIKIRKYTGLPVSLKLTDPIPAEAWRRYEVMMKTG